MYDFAVASRNLYISSVAREKKELQQGKIATYLQDVSQLKIGSYSRKEKDCTLL